MISLKIDWFDLLAVQGTFRSLVQHCSLKAFWLWVLPSLWSRSSSHKRSDHWNTRALAKPAFVGRIMSPLFHTLSRFVIAFLPRNNPLLISWPQSRSAVSLEPKERKSVIISTPFPSICHAVPEFKTAKRRGFPRKEVDYIL